MARWNKSSLDSTMRAALKLAAAWNDYRYVFCTDAGYQIDKEPPPFRRQHYIVRPDGEVAYWEWPGWKEYATQVVIRPGRDDEFPTYHDSQGREHAEY